jgi:hypothetical protein
MSGLTLVIIVVLITFVAVVIVLTGDDEVSTYTADADESFSEPEIALVNDSIADPIQQDEAEPKLPDDVTAIGEPTIPDRSYTGPPRFHDPKFDADGRDQPHVPADSDLDTEAEPADARAPEIDMPHSARSDTND